MGQLLMFILSFTTALTTSSIHDPYHQFHQWKHKQTERTQAILSMHVLKTNILLVLLYSMKQLWTYGYLRQTINDSTSRSIPWPFNKFYFDSLCLTPFNDWLYLFTVGARGEPCTHPLPYILDVKRAYQSLGTCRLHRGRSFLNEWEVSHRTSSLMPRNK